MFLLPDMWNVPPCRDRLCSVLVFQVHGLDAETWKKVDVVYIDIADRSQVEPKVKI